MEEPKSIIVLDLVGDESFPPCGENRSVLTISGTDATLEVFFDASEGSEDACIWFQFSGVSQATCSSFPGVAPASLASAENSLGRLVQVEKSDIARQWTAYWSRHGFPATLHYQLVLTEENRKYDIFARSVRVHRSTFSTGACDA